jgi:putative phosphoesterase
MRVAALYDIHGNLPALEAVLQEITHAEVDLIVVGGDVVAGPMPRETLERLLGLHVPVRFIQGNADREVVEQMKGAKVGALPERIAEVVRWVGQQLEPDHAQLLADWPQTLSLEVEGLGTVLFCHATPRTDTEIFTRLTLEERLLPVFAEVEASLIVCGHTHMQFDRRIGGLRVINAGSVGMPYGEPGAYWLLLGPEVEFQRTSYDRAQAAERLRATSYPQADNFVLENVLRTPTEEEAFGVFEPMALGGNKV